MVIHIQCCNTEKYIKCEVDIPKPIFWIPKLTDRFIQIPFRYVEFNTHITHFHLQRTFSPQRINDVFQKFHIFSEISIFLQLQDFQSLLPVSRPKLLNFDNCSGLQFSTI